MPYPQYQFGEPATTGYQQAAKAQMMKEQATPVNFDPNQLAQQAFGPDLMLLLCQYQLSL